MSVQEVRVPDIGDFSDVPVIEIHVTAGDTVAVDDPIMTLESDKATMDVPAPIAGTVTAVPVSVGDTVSEGDVILSVEVAEAEAAPAAETAQPATAATASAVEPIGHSNFSALHTSMIARSHPRSTPPASTECAFCRRASRHERASFPERNAVASRSSSPTAIR